MLILTVTISVCSQNISSVSLSPGKGLIADSLTLSGGEKILLNKQRPLFTLRINDVLVSSDKAAAYKAGPEYLQLLPDGIKATVTFHELPEKPVQCEISFKNNGSDTVSISNVVPFGEDSSSVYITGKGPWDLARAWLFRPGYRPLRVILPDNAWEMGYSSFSAGNSLSVCALARRKKSDGGIRKRYETLLPPGTSVTYAINSEIFEGDWQNGLRKLFSEKYLYDLESFDNRLFERDDLLWIKDSYLIILQMAWDREYYDRFNGQYNFPEFLNAGKAVYGNIDVFGIWPTWPRLGLDQRNQWDMYRDLPGGIGQLGVFAQLSHAAGTKFFISYNPWDNSTRKEDHYRGMARLISEIDADGVVLDTQGSSSFELQAAADSVKKGVVMYSEGMSVVKDMPGIISGRVHNAIFLSPELNLNKLIKPDFSIFRVCDVGEDLIHRELAVAFFNGYGTELNMFRPGGRDESLRKDLEFLGKTTLILRQNSITFRDRNWTPLIETKIDNVFVNRWKSGDKTIYTVLNMRSEGVNETLFKADARKGYHYISLWNHTSIDPTVENGEVLIRVDADGWQSSFTGTRREGSVDCIAEFPDLLQAKLTGRSIRFSPKGGTSVTLWRGDPSYSALKREFKVLNDTTVNVEEIFGVCEGKIVIQLMNGNTLVDENVLILKGVKPWLISKVALTPLSRDIPADMVLVPGASFSYNVTPNDEFIPYPEVSGTVVKVESFLMDRYPVTNSQFHRFISESGYSPADTSGYLKHWQNGNYRKGEERYPVVWVSYEDMLAYSKWAGKRLPTEAEWQLAAQGTDGRRWPWGNDFIGSRVNNASGSPTQVNAFPRGKSQYGAEDLVGNIWQMTGDIYFNGTNYLGVIRGGSYYKPESSWWYIQGGPQPLDKTQILLLTSPGLDRSATVGFRCVKDKVGSKK